MNFYEFMIGFDVIKQIRPEIIQRTLRKFLLNFMGTIALYGNHQIFHIIKGKVYCTYRSSGGIPRKIIKHSSGDLFLLHNGIYPLRHTDEDDLDFFLDDTIIDKIQLMFPDLDIRRVNIKKYRDILKKYSKTTAELVSQYIANPKSLTLDEIERIIIEAEISDLKLLENCISPKNKILNKIRDRFSILLSDGLKILL